MFEQIQTRPRCKSAPEDDDEMACICSFLDEKLPKLRVRLTYEPELTYKYACGSGEWIDRVPASRARGCLEVKEIVDSFMKISSADDATEYLNAKQCPWAVDGQMRYSDVKKLQYFISSALRPPVTWRDPNPLLPREWSDATRSQVVFRLQYSHDGKPYLLDEVTFWGEPLLETAVGHLVQILGLMDRKTQTGFLNTANAALPLLPRLRCQLIFTPQESCSYSPQEVAGEFYFEKSTGSDVHTLQAYGLKDAIARFLDISSPADAKKYLNDTHLEWMYEGGGLRFSDVKGIQRLVSAASQLPLYCRGLIPGSSYSAKEAMTSQVLFALQFTSNGEPYLEDDLNLWLDPSLQMAANNLFQVYDVLGVCCKPCKSVNCNGLIFPFRRRDAQYHDTNCRSRFTRSRK